MEATSVPRLGKPTAKWLGSGHHPTPLGTLCLSSSLLVSNVVPAAFFPLSPDDKFSLM